jgi:hypothetical protein
MASGDIERYVPKDYGTLENPVILGWIGSGSTLSPREFYKGRIGEAPEIWTVKSDDQALKAKR